MAPADPRPVLIGALGGSGTRSLVRVLRSAGVDFGQWTDPRTEDALAFRVFLARFFDQIVTALQTGEEVPRAAGPAFEETVRVHRLGQTQPGAAWGWKNPRNMWLLPFYVRFFPGLRFIHLVRDGRDMALSENRFLLTEHGAALGAGDPVADTAQAQLGLWARGNLWAAHCASDCLAADAYHIVRYEDLCRKPRAVLQKLLEFLGAERPDQRAAQCAQWIVPSTRLGAWRDDPSRAGNAPDPDVVRALEFFGYEV
jgi:hypothetical protein